ncbi:ankyrin repeat domain-containing protein 11 [Willisornis vidua]|uniref:Ankyrin repeat domain-containing protein 11 n=1 Tax=Willisornis vidua TaxID=1566151 RepID=A0ABQ9CYB4_9PASS|nr:ankyrin repeat domain-containing protein 11 [Willisornis vidua]
MKEFLGRSIYIDDLKNTVNEKPWEPLDKDKVSLTKTPKLDRSDGGKEVKERATKRKLPFTVGTNGDQKDSDTEQVVELGLLMRTC